MCIITMFVENDVYDRFKYTVKLICKVKHVHRGLACHKQVARKFHTSVAVVCVCVLLLAPIIQLFTIIIIITATARRWHCMTLVLASQDLMSQF